MTKLHSPVDFSAQPARFARRVLLTVSGLSPQVITETAFALTRADGEGEAWVPTEIHALTTLVGQERIADSLLQDGRGQYAALCRDHGLAPKAFTQERVHVVIGTDGLPLSDIRTPDDNAAMADAVTALVRDFTADDACALHVSLAGGRKTMGYYAGYALSLFGRPQDRLSHVLVSAPFESHQGFYYPPPRSRMLSLPGGQEVDASLAQVSLASIPFVRLREGLPRSLLSGRSSFAQTVDAAAASTRAPELSLDLASRRVMADGIALRLQPMPMAFLAVFAHRAIAGKPALRAPLRDAHDAEWAEEVLSDLRAVYGFMHVPDSVETSLLKEASGNKVSPQLSRLRAALGEQLAPGRDRLYFDDGDSHRHKRYRVPLLPSAIHITQPAASLPKPPR